MLSEALEPLIDNDGRITDKQGRPLRDRRARSFGAEPFRGQEGRPHPRLKRLEARIKSFEEQRPEVRAKGKRPGSVKG